MILEVESYFQNLCGQLNWSYAGLRTDLNQVIEFARNEEALSESDDLVILAIAEDSTIVFKLADAQGVPVRVENFEALSGSSRYYLGNLLIVASRSSMGTLLSNIAKFTAENWHEGTRIGLGICLAQTTSTKVYYKLDFFFPLNSSFGG